MTLSIFGPKPGTWSLDSESDPRWNCSGRCCSLCCLGIPKEAKEALETLKKQLHKDPPEDLYWSFYKD